jgi:branched-chain amino acid transport system ATP-binding protein
MTGPVLTVERLTKRFGGLVANDNLSLDIAPGELHAIIGPNGAGKTTLIGLLAGELTPDDGRITLAGQDVTKMPVYNRALAGLARSFQITSVFADLSLRDNVLIAAQAHRGHSFRFWEPARHRKDLRASSIQALRRVGLEPRADERAGNVSHGERRQLEIAMALVSEPKLVLLDEPTAGMGSDETQRMIGVLRQLKGHHATLLIEHDMDVVFTLADRITVMVNGRAIASGRPADIRANAAVREAYLG